MGRCGLSPTRKAYEHLRRRLDAQRQLRSPGQPAACLPAVSAWRNSGSALHLAACLPHVREGERRGGGGRGAAAADAARRRRRRRRRRGGGEARARRRAYAAALQPAVEQELRGEQHRVQPRARLRIQLRPIDGRRIRHRGERHTAGDWSGPCALLPCNGHASRGGRANRSSCRHLAHV